MFNLSWRSTWKRYLLVCANLPSSKSLWHISNQPWDQMADNLLFLNFLKVVVTKSVSMSSILFFFRDSVHFSLCQLSYLILDSSLHKFWPFPPTMLLKLNIESIRSLWDVLFILYFTVVRCWYPHKNVLNWTCFSVFENMRTLTNILFCSHYNLSWHL